MPEKPPEPFPPQAASVRLKILPLALRNIQLRECFFKSASPLDKRFVDPGIGNALALQPRHERLVLPSCELSLHAPL